VSERKDCLTTIAPLEKAQEAKEAGNIREQAVLKFWQSLLQSSQNQLRSFLLKFPEPHRRASRLSVEIVSDISDPELQARIADILWVKRRDYRMAQLAVATYNLLK